MVSHILRVSVIGDMPNGEVWSVNPCWELDGSAGVLLTPGDAQAIATAIAAITLPTALSLTMQAGTTWARVRVEGRTLAGNLEVQADAAKATPTNGTGTNTHPHGTAIVISLRTPGVGASARGRMYWPATGQALQSTDYRISPANATSILSGAKTFLSGIETAVRATAGSNANLTVWSRTTSNFHNVNALQIGNVLDSQRRRRDALQEGYTSTTFP